MTKGIASGSSRWGPTCTQRSLSRLFEEPPPLIIQIAQEFSRLSLIEIMAFCCGGDRKNLVVPKHGEGTHFESIRSGLGETSFKGFILLKKLEIHHTPLHGSWLNMAEIEFAALACQCLSRRIGTVKEREQQVHAWQEQRNAATTTICWRFTSADARIKLKRLYPSLET
jgi:hypothetical protein